MIANNKGADQTARKTSAFIVLEISRIVAHVMLKPRHPCFCLAARLYLGNKYWDPQGFGGAGEKGYIFSGSWAALVIISEI